jgi:hypothetical protein
MKVDHDGSLDLSPRHRVRVGWLVLAAGTGAVFVGTALGTEAAWEWQGTVPSLFIEIGTGLGLVSVLFLLEQRFVDTLRAAVTGTCPLADPPSSITKAAVLGGDIVWMCDHMPQHRWAENGERLPDWTRT